MFLIIRSRHNTDVDHHPCISHFIGLRCRRGPYCLDDATSLKILPSGKGCKDKEPEATCKAIFTAPQVAGEKRDAANTTTKCGKPDLAKVAKNMCPNYCGFCCTTPEYSCENKPYAQTGLNCTNMADKCEDKNWKPIIAENCPATCGMCLAAGGCVDKAPDCASQPTICFNVNFIDWAKENCARTCNQCPKLGATTAAAGATTAEKKLSFSCDDWARNGKFCNNTFYQDQWYKCIKACGKC